MIISLVKSQDTYFHINTLPTLSSKIVVDAHSPNIIAQVRALMMPPTIRPMLLVAR